MIVPLTPIEFQQRAIALFGDKVGIVDGEKRFTYAQINERANRLGNAMRASGVQPGQVVSSLCMNTHHLMEGFYGSMQAGAIFNPLSPQLDAKALVQVLRHADCSLLIFHANFAPLVEAIRAQLPGIRHYVVVESRQPIDHTSEYEEFLAGAASTPLTNIDDVDENSIANIFYVPDQKGGFRGVVLTHRTLYLHAVGSLLANGYGKDDVVLSLLPMFAANGFGVPQTMPAIGATQILLRNVDIDSILRLIQQERVTRLLIIPGLLNAILHHAELDNYDTSSLVSVWLGGADITTQLIKSAGERLNCAVQVGYGQIEGSPVMVFGQPRMDLLPDEEGPLGTLAPAGRPLVGVRVRVLDNDGKDVPADDEAVGEIVVRSNTIMQGYHNNQLATNEKIIDGWYHTGDLATITGDGRLTYVGEGPLSD